METPYTSLAWYKSYTESYIHIYCQKIGIKIEPTNATIRVANGDTAKGIGEVRNLPAVFDDMVVPLNFIVLEYSVFRMILGNPKLKYLQICYKFSKTGD